MRIGHCQLEANTGDFEANLAKVVQGLERMDRDRGEIVLAQEDADSTAHLSGPEYEAFLREHEPCRAKVKGGPLITKRRE